MFRGIFRRVLTAAVVLCMTGIAMAENPIVQTNYTADPAPMVYNDTFWVYSGHDEDAAEVWFNMQEWRCYSSVDMVNWTDHGSPIDLSVFSWANADAWAAQCIPHNGKFYFAAPVFHTGTKDRMIGIAVADKPTGPFKDAIGKPLLSRNDCCYIDPSLYVDDDDQAYMYWGNPYCFYVKMNNDMISYTGEVVQIPENRETFSSCYGEGPWLYKRNDLYYMIWAADNSTGNENIRYSTAPTATGPWSYQGIIMPTQGLTWAEPCTSWTNHPGIVDFKGHSYFVYHNAAAPGGSAFRRSTCIEEFTYNDDGSIPQINMTLNGRKQIEKLNPYDTTQAETICWAQGVKTETCSEGGMDVCKIENGDYIKVRGVDFNADGAEKFEARVASASSGGSIELHLDTITGPKVGTCAVSGTGGWQSWATKSCTVTGVTGVHDLYFKFTGGNGSLFNFNWWKFTPVAVATKSGNTTPTASLSRNAIKIASRSGSSITLQINGFALTGLIAVQLFDLSGKLVATLFEGELGVNGKSLLFDAKMVPSGSYLVRVAKSGSSLLSKKIQIN